MPDLIHYTNDAFRCLGANTAKGKVVLDWLEMKHADKTPAEQLAIAAQHGFETETSDATMITHHAGVMEMTLDQALGR